MNNIHFYIFVALIAGSIALPSSPIEDSSDEYTTQVPEYTTRLDNGNITTLYPEYTTTGPDNTTDIGNITTDFPEYTTGRPDNTTDSGNITTQFPEYTTTRPDNTTDSGNITTQFPEYTTTRLDNTTDIGNITTDFPEYSTARPDNTTDSGNITTQFPEYTPTEYIPEKTTSDFEEITTINPILEWNITYHLYNSLVWGKSYNSSSVEVSELDHDVGTIVIIHSYAGDRFDRFSTNVLSAFNQFTNFNVFVMDWSIYARSHLEALKNLADVADDLAKFLETVRISKQSANNRFVHLVGFGTGAHLAGNAASNLYTILPVGRVTGLDPTGSIVSHNSSHILSSADASYVEAIHTDGGDGENYGIGLSVAHVDFFPNGGIQQPGCWSHLCNHNRAWELFVASLQYNHHRGFRCIDWNQMVTDNCYGLSLALGGIEFMKVPMLPGIYRLNTENTFPF